MRILITGGTGFVGSSLIRHLRARGHEFVILTRAAEAARNKLGQAGDRFVAWDGRSPLPATVFDGVEAVINLAGEGLASKRWTPMQKQRILDSRLELTRALVAGINDHGRQCRLLISASAIGYYPVNLEQALDESTPPAEGFMADVCRLWEAETQALNPGVRRVILRIGVVLGKGGGVIARLLPVFRTGFGGPVGNGLQIMSWIHLDDLVGIITHALDNQAMAGVYNAVAPNPVSNRQFSRALGQALHRPALVPVPAVALRGAMGEMAAVVLDSQNISSHKVEKEAGYRFRHPDIEQAVKAALT